jgi:lipopolysaccharide cholinephosphotransferase
MNFNILIPDVRESGETRLKQCHLVMMRMLKILDYLCTKHDIKYFLTGGSLLGAVRFKGIIPWDDDMDIGMTRENYEKFVQYAVPEIPEDIFFQSDATDPHFPACHIVEAKLRDRYSTYNHKKSRKWQDGLMVDIFVYDRSYLPNNYLIYVLNSYLKSLWYHKPDGNKKRAKVLKWIAKYTPVPLVYDSSLVNNRKKMKSGKFYFKEKELATLIRAKFEDMETWIPAGYDPFLARQYGDYMNDNRPRQHGIDLPDPFTPCNHMEILQWKDRKNLVAL